jgi:hypothetical protein
MVITPAFLLDFGVWLAVWLWIIRVPCVSPRPSLSRSASRSPPSPVASQPQPQADVVDLLAAQPRACKSRRRWWW